MMSTKTTSTSLPTKEKVLSVAGDLFSRKGYDATSIREIAAEAGVNISAINYHFQNKENLYLELFRSQYQWMQEAIETSISLDSCSLLDLSLTCFDLFWENYPMLMNSFKTMMGQSVIIPKGLICQNEDLGPPGSNAFLKVIERELGSQLSFKQRYWLMRVIFGHIIHTCLVMKTPFAQDKLDQIPYSSKDQLKESLKQLVNTLIHHTQLET